MKVTIRRASPEDAESFLRIMRDTWYEAYVNDDIGITLEEIKKSYADALNPERIQAQQRKFASAPDTEERLIAEVDGKAVGIAKGHKSDPLNFFDTLYILPQYQGQGIGSLLLNKILGFLGDDRPIELEVASYNHQTISFYAYHGFIDTGKRLELPLYEEGPMLPLMVMQRSTK